MIECLDAIRTSAKASVPSPKGLGLAASFLAAFAFCWPKTALAQTIPLEEKVRFDSALEQKAQSVLVEILGPGKAKVTVDAEIDFTKVESFKLSASTAAVEAARHSFLWNNISDVKSSDSARNILPGFPVPDPKPAGVAAQDFEHRTNFPAAYVNKLSVTLILDESVAAAQASTARSALINVLGVKPERGDAFTVMRTRLPSPWQIIWQTSDAAWFIVKYGILIALCLFSVLVVGMCLIKMAAAMGSMAQVQMHQIQLDSSRPQLLEGGSSSTQINLLETARKDAGQASEVREAEEIVELKPEHLEDLPIFLGSEENAASAVPILFLLPPDQAARVISAVPEARRQSLVLEVSNTVHLDADTLAEARARLRSFVESHAAGGKRLRETLALVPEEMQDSILKDVSASSPKLARDLRESLMRFEDLLKLSSDELGLVLTQAPREVLALALRGFPNEVRAKFLAALPEQMRRVVAQYLELTAPQPLSKVREARRAVIDLWRRLQAEGRVRANREASEPLI